MDSFELYSAILSHMVIIIHYMILIAKNSKS
jgi:hypothetical protein